MNLAEDTLESLDDLLHDLGKYIALPITMLPPTAHHTELRDAVQSALLKTRTSPMGTQTAQAIWDTFCKEVGNQLTGFRGWHRLIEAVDTACAWAERINDTTLVIDRTQVTDDMRAVSAAIRALQDECNE